MYAIAIALLGAMLLTWSLATSEPQQIVTRTQVTADALAANFWAYRGALVAYQNAYPNLAVGPIAPVALKPFLPTGYVPLMQTTVTSMQTNLPQCASLPPSLTLWSNFFQLQDHQLYTYSSATADCLPAGAIDAIANRHERSMMIGIAQFGIPMTMTSLFNQANSAQATYTLPLLSGIPAGALVVVGN